MFPVEPELEATLHFHDQEKVSVVFESNEAGDERFHELVFAACYAFRHLANLGNDAVGRSLALVLSRMDPPSLTALIGKRTDAGATLVPYQGAPGFKRFTARLRPRPMDVDFRLRVHGFGLFGRGLGYYSPTSVVMLLQFLAERRLLDEEYLTVLAQLMAHIGKQGVAGRVKLGDDRKYGLALASHFYHRPAPECVDPLETVGQEVARLWYEAQREPDGLVARHDRALWLQERRWLDVASLFAGLAISKSYTFEFRDRVSAYLSAYVKWNTGEEALGDELIPYYWNGLRKATQEGRAERDGYARVIAELLSARVRLDSGTDWEGISARGAGLARRALELLIESEHRFPAS